MTPSLNDLPLVHVTKRALEWLRAHRSGQKRTPYVSPPGVSACGVRSEDWCRTEDVRAILNGEHHAVLWNGPNSAFRRRVLMPTCPKCAVLLDQEMER
jgi:hypothetical protein